jgi:hypothetical protein
MEVLRPEAFISGNELGNLWLESAKLPRAVRMQARTRSQHVPDLSHVPNLSHVPDLSHLPSVVSADEYNQVAESDTHGL